MQPVLIIPQLYRGANVVIMVLLLCFSLAGCSSGGTGDGDSSGTQLTETPVNDMSTEMFDPSDTELSTLTITVYNELADSLQLEEDLYVNIEGETENFFITPDDPAASYRVTLPDEGTYDYEIWGSTITVAGEYYDIVGTGEIDVDMGDSFTVQIIESDPDGTPWTYELVE